MTLHVEAGFDMERFEVDFSVDLYENNALVDVVSMPVGTHFLTIDGTSITKPDGETAFALGYTPFLVAFKDALEKVGVGTYTVSHNAVTNRITVTASGVASFRFGTTSITAQRILGMSAAQANALIQTGNQAPWYRIQTAQGILSDYFWDEEEDGDLGEDVMSHGGDSYAIAEDEVAVLFNAMIPLEPRAALWNEFTPTTASTPFTWQRLYRHARNVEPVCLDFADGSIVRKFFLRFRREGRLFRAVPRQTRNWWEYGDVEIQARLLGKI